MILSESEHRGLLKFLMFQAALNDGCSTFTRCSNDKKFLFTTSMPALPARPTNYEHSFISPANSHPTEQREEDDWGEAERPHLFMSPDDPSSHIRAKQLKKAVLEHYRSVCLDMIPSTILTLNFLVVWKRYITIA